MPQPPYYEDDVRASDPLRAEQAAELDRYVRHLRATADERAETLFRPDYRSARGYERSVRPLRDAFARAHGWPPPGARPSAEPTFTRIGEDALGVYHRAVIPVLPQVNAEGIYIVPKNAGGKVPLVISMHGGGGSPEVALFHGGSNYHDMVRGGVKRGYAVFAPQHLFRAPGYPDDVRNRTDDRLRLLGTSLTAVEVAKITRSLDVLLARPEIDAKRVGMVGLSYGGYYALMAPALEPRIRAVVSSCYFGVQEWRYARDENGLPSDFRFPERMSLLTDDRLCALICPRALSIQAGKGDAPSHRDGGIALAPKVAEHYRRLGRADAFEFVLFDGGHEFDDASAWAFLAKHL